MHFICCFQIEAEKTKAEAVQQEIAASKMKEENQAIRDEAEADLSTFYFLGIWKFNTNPEKVVYFK